jgi:hypothetical protein
MMGMSINEPSRVWQPLAAMGLALFIAMAALPAFAGIQEMRVLAVGKHRSSATASAMALDYARKRAVYLVARKMQVENPSEALAALKPEQWNEILRGATVVQEKRVGEITYAEVRVSVVEEALRKALKIEDPVATEIDASSAARGLLVIPVLVGESRVYLWENENSINGPTRSQILRRGMGEVLVPPGDFEDRRLIDYNNALQVTAQEMEPMYTRYGADEIIIAVTTLGLEGTEEPVSILLRRLPHPPLEGRVEEITVPMDKKATRDVRATKAAATIANAAGNIASATSQLMLEQLKKATQVPVSFRYTTAQNLGTMQETVRATKGVLHLAMPTITLDKMSGVVYLTGEKEAVRAALEKQQLTVTDDQEGWIVSTH